MLVTSTHPLSLILTSSVIKYNLMPVSKNGYYYYNIPKWTSHCQQYEPINIELKSIILFFALFYLHQCWWHLFFDTDIKCNKILFKASVEENGCHKNMSKLSSHYQHTKKSCSSLCFCAIFIAINAHGIVTSNIFDTDFKCKKV
jgi:hypothetical protein